MEAVEGLRRYFIFYNEKRLHQSLGYKTPSQIYYGDANEENVYNDGVNKKAEEEGNCVKNEARYEVAPVALRAPFVTSHNN